MKFRHYTIILIVFVVSVFNLGFSQSHEINVKFIANCGIQLSDGTANIYVDFPYKSGAHGYMEYDKAELDSIPENSTFIFTHKHSDHYSEKILKKVQKEKHGKAFGPWNIADLETLGQTIPEFDIQAFKTEHKVYGLSFEHYSYLLTWHNQRIYISGDTGNSETIGEAKNIDWAFVPAWLLVDSNEKHLRLDAKMVAIYHIGPKDNVNITGNQVVMLKTVGQKISIPY